MRKKHFHIFLQSKFADLFYTCSVSVMDILCTDINYMTISTMRPTNQTSIGWGGIQIGKSICISYAHSKQIECGAKCLSCMHSHLMSHRTVVQPRRDTISLKVMGRWRKALLASSTCTKVYRI